MTRKTTTFIDFKPLQAEVIKLRKEKKKLREALIELHNYTKHHRELVGFIRFDYLSNRAYEVIRSTE